MNNKIVIKNREPQEIKISGGGDVVGITNVYVNGIDVTEGNVAYVIVPTKLSELQNNMGFITQEVDPTVPYYVKQITQADINKWNNKQDLLVSGTNIKTINDNSIIGSGNIEISTDYTAGTGIEITEENVINNTITSYNDLTDLPTIPSKTSDLLNDSGYVTSDDLSEVAFTGSYVSLSNTPTVVSDFINDANYVDMSFIWNMLPKLTDTDSTISLTPTVLNAPLKISLNPSTLSQDGTPTPTSPQDIHTISGYNKISVIQNNLFDYTTINGVGGGTNNNDGTIITSSGDYNTIIYFPTITLSAGTYYIAIDIKQLTGNKEFVKINDASINWEEVTAPTISSEYQRYIYKHTYTSTTSFNRILVQFTNVPGECKLGNIIVSTMPYNITDYPIDLGDIEYCKTGNYEDKFIRNSGKNLIDYLDTKGVGARNGTSDIIASSTSISGDILTINQTYAQGGAIFKFNNITPPKVLNGQKVTISFIPTTLSGNIVVGIGNYNGGGTNNIQSGISTATVNNRFSITLTALSDYDKLALFIQGQTSALSIKNVQVEISDSATEYQPYGSGEYYKKKMVGVIVLDGTEEWTIHSLGNNNYLLRHPMSNYMKNVVIYTNYYKGIQNQDNRTLYDAYLRNDNTLALDILDNSYTSADDFKTWLSTHNLIVYYVLATPTYTKITDEDLILQLENIQTMKTYNEQTNISQINADLPFQITAETVKSLVNE